MNNKIQGGIALFVLIAAVACGCRPDAIANLSGSSPQPPAPSSSPANPREVPAAAAKKAFRISGTIDDAIQEGDVCDTTKKFTVPGTLLFEFTPTSPTKGNYTYSGPFNATGSGPYEIRDDGTMLVDGTGCIMGKCATYSHEWKATPIDPKDCKPGS